MITLNNYSPKMPVFGEVSVCSCFNFFCLGIALPCYIGTNGDGIPYFWYLQFNDESKTPTIVAISEEQNQVCEKTSGHS